MQVRKVYLDNAASTFIEPAVLDAMLPYFQEWQGNPSSTHYHGRIVKNALENARKTIAELLNAKPSEIFFTSGGTEADNMAIFGCVEQYNIQHIISSPLEHHAVTHTIEYLDKKGIVQAHWLENDPLGRLNFMQLENLLRQHKNTLVVLMHGNNEIGNLLDLEYISALCKENQAFLLSDTVQTVGHYPISHKLGLSFFCGSAHKFHGPKGIGFLYINQNVKIACHIHGGSQERNLRAGTENLPGVIGMAKALEIAIQNQEKNHKHLKGLKSYFIQKLKESIPEVEFNGDIENSMASVINVCFPSSEYDDMLLFQLDIQGISASAGSACTSGSNVGSHVLRALGLSESQIKNSVRFSFSRFTTYEELDYTLDVLQKMFVKSYQN
ncbi:MAG: cysteine desulfurase [Bacteroidia bacterium]|nr:cysteine desulfurase [Bacteroidia bacterium]MDW8347160.1 cysteine desulfurase family protein [Bacteroidia bacterium]